jgi:hypothetical protein
MFRDCDCNLPELRPLSAESGTWEQFFAQDRIAKRVAGSIGIVIGKNCAGSNWAFTSWQRWFYRNTNHPRPRMTRQGRPNVAIAHQGA